MRIPAMRRIEKMMSEEDSCSLLERGFCGRIATTDGANTPYVVPVSFVVADNRIVFHHVHEEGRLNENLRKNPLVCFETDEPGEVFSIGASPCQTSMTFRSVIAFGEAKEVTDTQEKLRCLEMLMLKYAAQKVGESSIPESSLNNVCVYAITIVNLTGKETVHDKGMAKD